MTDYTSQDNAKTCNREYATNGLKRPSACARLQTVGMRNMDAALRLQPAAKRGVRCIDEPCISHRSPAWISGVQTFTVTLVGKRRLAIPIARGASRVRRSIALSLGIRNRGDRLYCDLTIESLRKARGNRVRKFIGQRLAVGIVFVLRAQHQAVVVPCATDIPAPGSMFEFLDNIEGVNGARFGR